MPRPRRCRRPCTLPTFFGCSRPPMLIALPRWAEKKVAWDTPFPPRPFPPSGPALRPLGSKANTGPARFSSGVSCAPGASVRWLCRLRLRTAKNAGQPFVRDCIRHWASLPAGRPECKKNNGKPVRCSPLGSRCRCHRVSVAVSTRWFAVAVIWLRKS
ncbi:MAG: hypothetical protein BJ554DRAFT_1395 [Olpidium bornovanus]|uniref:Uncharacterized protein n=1 Tax=Olpidium bornovanus TaxID=278681 RepID=A0A8H7ZRN3_9FUNG|nr:MAG: hypothetical protein BJ554DRAFT_1395 [Olpidium bornovanus]